ncbi:MAG: rhodanese-like domain-containing protein [Propionibacteriaceae bacterium]|nr:rhodanese-like domain-containing protein [Propionibacteriaceae bacterium]
MLRTIAILLGAVVLPLSLSGCTQGDAADVAVNDTTVVIDVRTPEEYAAGHLEGAQLLDLTSGEFAAALPQLDPDAEYLVYCRSGNRSGQAVSLMKDAGFPNATNLGSLEEAADATGITIVS